MNPLHHFQKMPRSQKFVTTAMLVALFAVYFYTESTQPGFDDSEPQNTDWQTDRRSRMAATQQGNRDGVSPDRAAPQSYPTAPWGATERASAPEAANRSTPSGYPDLTQRVVVVDRGMQMPIGAAYLPEGWRANQDIAYNPNDGAQMRYRFELLGPNGELVRSSGTAFYSAMDGQNFQNAAYQQVAQLVGGELQQVSPGPIRPSAILQNSTSFRQAAGRMQAQGYIAEALEIPLQGSRGGRPYQGVAYLSHYYSPTMPGIGSFTANAVIAPQERIQEAVEVNRQVAESFEVNPQYQQAMAQIRSVAAQRQNQQHQQRMAASQAQFEAHQQKMKGIYQANDARNAAWLKDFRGSGSTAGSNSAYSSHDAYIDSIHERSTFDDPSTGQQRAVDGQFDYNYTNNQGDFVGTNDPSFNANSMQGDWQEIEPLRPNQ